MSYILQALAKSQRERELGQVPTPTSESHAKPEAAESTKAALIIGLILATIAAGGMTYALMALRGGDAQQARPVSTPAAPVATPRQQSTSVSAADASTTPEPTTPELPAGVTPAASRSEPVMPLPPTIDPRPPEGIADEREHDRATARPTAMQEQAETAPRPRTKISDLRQELIELKQQLQQQAESAPDDQRPAAAIEQSAGATVGPPVSPVLPAPALSQSPTVKATPAKAQQLPADVYNRLPVRKLSVLAYSQSPQRRFVIVNSQKMTEGGRSNEGLVVEEIRQDGVIFSFEGHRFFDSP